MLVECPNCNQSIELVGAAEMKEEFGLGSNSVQHARDKGKFPEPWLSFGNRNIWLRTTIEGYVEAKRTTQLESTVAELMKTLEHMPIDERLAVIEKVEQLKP